MKSFDPEKYYLGKVCPRGHEWDGTGKGLRTIKGKQCPDCRPFYQKEVRQRDMKKECVLPLEAQSFLLEAHADPSKYFLGNPCKEEGHKLFNGQAIRSKRDRSCLMCRRERSKRQYWKDPEKAREVQGNRDRGDYNKDWHKTNRDRLLPRMREKYQAWKQSRTEEDYRRYRAKQEQWAKRNAHRCHVQRVKKRENTVPYSVQQLDELLTSWNGCCAYCSVKLKPVSTRTAKGKDLLVAKTFDHVIPLSSGGLNALANLVPACRSCNSSKNRRDMLIWYKDQAFYDEARCRRIIESIDVFLVGEVS